MSKPNAYDVIVLGAGAAGLMCAGAAAKRGRSVLVIEQANAPGEKIRISGGGRCNFTNLHTTPANFLSQNPRFCVSALAGYTQRDFIALVDKYAIAYHEKTRGQLFCDGSARQIVDLLMQECRAGNVQLRFGLRSPAIARDADGFVLTSEQSVYRCRSLVVATGGPSIPKMGASGFGYKVAEQFGLTIVPPRAALVPLTFAPDLLPQFAELSGIAVDAVVSCGKVSFDEALLFTHRGLSGPAILQISSYWREGADIVLDMAPSVDVLARLKQLRREHPRQEPATALADFLPKRLAQAIADRVAGPVRIADASDKLLQTIAAAVKAWRLRPNGTEGFRTAEVTLGGIDTSQLSSKTLECKSVPGLYFIGEVVDVTGHLGGFNFQWAWSSGYAAAQRA
ncbi:MULTISPECIES: NAD(P)/FAD-dependent oxidoreductase [Rhodopseudomonas]|uniref:Membrane protein n=1 Tax=Rhodopseudomonas palustris TaxID=1076 RepID=A0A0D7EVR1_RHOPL|nr:MULTISPECIES: NAD(P)/FAD-dependent oxidoreductase [Rhodopseudomonas]KIZ44878.1 membrane protein [Rhodopseudomonas palustris]MDF3812173.1 NAD(P)/FAD-dependent oxidoreductase [Rhodopseudomonas sp. BAL398]WOK18121.1 NAD(P)/FAD-dependent oxidoreductase [Rhodopseudomonas sp. BAL398]